MHSLGKLGMRNGGGLVNGKVARKKMGMLRKVNKERRLSAGINRIGCNIKWKIEKVDMIYKHPWAKTMVRPICVVLIIYISGEVSWRRLNLQHFPQTVHSQELSLHMYT